MGIYEQLSESLKYTANGLISNRQRPYGNATTRRKYVQAMLRNKYRNLVALDVFDKATYYETCIDNIDYYRDIEKTVASVHIGGHHEFMLDRAQLQYIGLGVCTISCKLPEILPNNSQLIPGIHYIECRDKYADLLTKTDWCKANPDKCIEIGQNAKKFFRLNCTPTAVCGWIKKCLKIGN